MDLLPFRILDSDRLIHQFYDVKTGEENVTLNHAVATPSLERPSCVPEKVDTPKPRCIGARIAHPNEMKFGCAQVSRVDSCALTRVRARLEATQVEAYKPSLDSFVSCDFDFTQTLYTFRKSRA
ncbi:hypothetical protein CRG98_018933 [Punica granatum]|uniref:Uncharacterized protein n=1 Tax=Punica granatum TaxID=22663 RepID=A0A2I0JZ13_PUNGR|nr:hypothetical protein CRG98_018933 [Punica granatum]